MKLYSPANLMHELTYISMLRLSVLHYDNGCSTTMLLHEMIAFLVGYCLISGISCSCDRWPPRPTNRSLLPSVGLTWNYGIQRPAHVLMIATVACMGVASSRGARIRVTATGSTFCQGTSGSLKTGWLRMREEQSVNFNWFLVCSI